MFGRTFGALIANGRGQVLLSSSCRFRICALATAKCHEIQFVRSSHLTNTRHLHADKSKLEETLKMLKEQAKQEENDGLAQKQMMEKSVRKTAKEPVYVRWPRLVRDVSKHYYHGFRLLILEICLSSKYLWRFLLRRPLLRRERQQLVRTLSDVLRLIPFSAFIIIPFMEFTLPFFLKLFPNMLPSTFKDASKEEEKVRLRLRANLEIAKLLQAAIEEMALYKKKSAKENDKNASTAVDFAEFIKKVRTEGSYVTNKDLMKYIKLFEDELTLDNLPENTLRALCRLLDIQPFGSLEIMRFLLIIKLRALKTDDHEISLEGGVDALSVAELQLACRARGMRSIGISEERLRKQLNQWLELSLNDKVPPSLLLLSRTLYLPEDITFTDRLKALITSLPESIAEETRQNLAELEGEQVSYHSRLQLIQNIEKGISDERKLMEEAKKREEEAKKREMEEAAKKKAAAEAAAASKPTLEVEIPSIDQAPILVVETSKVEKAAAVGDKAEIKEGSESFHEQVQSLENVIHGSPIFEVKHDMEELREQVTEHNEELIELDHLAKDLKEPRGAKMLRARVVSMMKKADKLLSKLEEDRKTLGGAVTESVPDEVAEAEKIKRAKLLRVDDVINSLRKLQKLENEEREELEKIAYALDEDSDGVINVNLVLRALDLLSNHRGLRLTPEQITKIVEMLKKEEEFDAMNAFIMGSVPYPPARLTKSPLPLQSSSDEPSNKQSNTQNTI